MRKTLPIIAFILLRYIDPAAGALDTTTGSERHLWDGGKFSVIVARVLSIKALENHGEGMGGTHIASVELFATLAGHFDPSKTGLLEVRFYVGDTTTSIKTAPIVGSIVIAVIHPGFIDGDEKRPYIAVTSDECTFMPNQSSLVQVKSLDDKRILEVLDRVRKARAETD